MREPILFQFYRGGAAGGYGDLELAKGSARIGSNEEESGGWKFDLWVGGPTLIPTQPAGNSSSIPTHIE